MSSTPPDDKAELVVAAKNPEGFRLLKTDELVSQGDFVADGPHGFKLWEGPGGFRADSFVRAIYRKRTHRPTEARKQP